MKVPLIGKVWPYISAFAKTLLAAADAAAARTILGVTTFDPASPGSIGGTTPGTIKGTTITSTLQFVSALGTNAAPGIIFTGTQTGFFMDGGGNVCLGKDGVTYVQWSPFGSGGIYTGLIQIDDCNAFNHFAHPSVATGMYFDASATTMSLYVNNVLVATLTATLFSALFPFVLKSYTVATLPSASTSGAGATAFVTDASTTVILGLGTTVAGSGSNKVPVYSDGTNWIIG